MLEPQPQDIYLEAHTSRARAAGSFFGALGQASSLESSWERMVAYKAVVAARITNILNINATVPVFRMYLYSLQYLIPSTYKYVYIYNIYTYGYKIYVYIYIYYISLSLSLKAVLGLNSAYVLPTNYLPQAMLPIPKTETANNPTVEVLLNLRATNASPPPRPRSLPIVTESPVLYPKYWLCQHALFCCDTASVRICMLRISWHFRFVWGVCGGFWCW